MTLQQVLPRRRRAITQDTLATIAPPAIENTPATVHAVSPSVDLASWIGKHKNEVDTLLLTHGGVLFRGFGVINSDTFEQSVSAISDELLEYTERSSPRAQIASTVYTSTDHPPDQPIVLHNEQSYTLNWPMRISFCCPKPASNGGATPTADVRRILSYLETTASALVRAFEEKGVCYVRNYIPGISLAWQTAFQTESQSAVEDHCRRAKIEWEWLPGDRLRTRQCRPAVVRHPYTNERVWFNHAYFFNVASLQSDLADALTTQFGDDELPYQTQYGDGARIEATDLTTLKNAYLKHQRSFDWQAGDVMMLDNMLMAHGRAPFAGERTVWTIMSDPYQNVKKSCYRSSTPTVKNTPKVGRHPLTILAQHPGQSLAKLIELDRGEIKRKLLEHGALLFRGFDVSDPVAFRDSAVAFSPNLLDYQERAAERQTVIDMVFTSTALANDQVIPLHHEMSYSHHSPRYLYFYCDTPPTAGGETPLAWEADTYLKIPEPIKAEFEAKKVMYVRNYSAHLDLSWQHVFQTDDREAVEAYCRTANILCEWNNNGDLRTKQIRQAISYHPDTNQKVWFNHAALFHPSNLPHELRAALIRARGVNGLPRSVFFGDGSQISDEVATELRSIYQNSSVSFPWQRHDVLLVDNFLCTHGRNPFQGDRRILVAMSDSYTHKD